MTDSASPDIDPDNTATHYRGPAIIKTSVLSVIDSMDAILSDSSLRGLMTGFTGLDKLTNGLRGGEVFVIASRPSMGKSSLAMNLVEHMSIGKDRPAPGAFFSLDLSSNQLVQRMICSRAKIELSRSRSGLIRKSEFSILMKEAAEIAESPIWIDDTPCLTIDDFSERAAKLKQEHDIQYIVIDYLQQLRASHFRESGLRSIQMTEISGAIKLTARELNIPVIVLSQLGRQVDQRRGRPRISDLKDSSAIEEDADIVGLLVREAVYAGDEYENEYEDGMGEASLIIAKNRNGSTGDVPLLFQREFMRFTNRESVEEDSCGTSCS